MDITARKARNRRRAKIDPDALTDNEGVADAFDLMQGDREPERDPLKGAQRYTDVDQVAASTSDLLDFRATAN